MLTRAHSPGSGAFLKIRVPAGAPTPPPSLLRALRHVLRPLVRLLLSNHVTHPTLAQLLKEVYVDVAVRDFPIEGKAQTDSRITLLTGIHRKDVKQLRGELGGENVAPRSVSLGALLVARWTGTPAYMNREGRPRALAWGGGSRKEPTFDDLVSSVSRDIRPRAILDELLRLGVVRIDESNRVWLDTEAYVPTEGFDEKAFFFGRNLHDHVASAARNLSGVRPALLERSVYYGNLTRESTVELARLAARTGMEALQAVNRRAIELKKRDAGKRAARHRMSFGSYFYEADATLEDTPPPASDDDD